MQLPVVIYHGLEQMIAFLNPHYSPQLLYPIV